MIRSLTGLTAILYMFSGLFGFCWQYLKIGLLRNAYLLTIHDRLALSLCRTNPSSSNRIAQ